MSFFFTFRRRKLFVGFLLSRQRGADKHCKCWKSDRTGGLGKVYRGYFDKFLFRSDSN